MTEAHYARSVRKLGPDVVIPLLVKGDRIRLKDGTRLLYGEGFDEESEEVDVPSPAQEDIPSYGGGGVEYDAGAAPSGGAQQEAGSPGQPIPFEVPIQGHRTALLWASTRRRQTTHSCRRYATMSGTSSGDDSS